jgi:uncharacterized protein (DUF2252 family)
MTHPDLITRIQTYNQGRIDKMLQRKYAGMAENPFRFYRGTCHLFGEYLAGLNPLPPSPAVWACGDLHLENFGSYQADNGLEYFDLNDFDEGALAPCLWDVARLLVSVVLAAEVLLRTNEISAHELCRSFLYNYVQVLRLGHVGMVEQRTAKGLVKHFLRAVGKRKRADLVGKRTQMVKKQRQLVVDEEKVSEIPADKKEQVAFIIKKWAERNPDSRQPHPNFYQVLDVGYRIAGTGSLGLERYVLLVEGKGSPEDNYLLDLKVAQPSALLPHLPLAQLWWSSEAERVVQVQRRMQFFSPALLTTVELDGMSYTLKQLQPSQDKMDLSLCKGKLSKLDQVLTYFAQVVAYAQLRSSGRQGSATADELIDFASQDHWQQPLMNFVTSHAKQVQADYETFVAGYHEKAFA